jgi:dolichol-phosphate mannosyltransferase
VGTLQAIENTGNAGFGYSIRLGLEKYTGDCVAIVMGDLSDSPDDLVKFYHKLQEGYDAVFGSRFIRGGKTINYPWLKMRINRLANGIVRLCFGIRYNDTTNAFKLYKRETINGLKPLLSPHFNITLELPLKVIVRGYSYAVLPNTWTNRKAGQSKLKIREMGSRYFFILLYCLIERFFSKGDFRKKVELRNYEKKGI